MVLPLETARAVEAAAGRLKMNAVSFAKTSEASFCEAKMNEASFCEANRDS